MSAIDFKVKRDRSKEILRNHKYQEVSQQAVSQFPLLYELDTQIEHNKQVYPVDPSFRLQRMGNGIDGTQPLVDVDTKLLNIDKRATKDLVNHMGDFKNSKILNLKDGFMEQGNTRFSNPAFNIKGMGINRWYQLYKNPQENCIEPFSRIGENSVLSTLDNHVPCPVTDKMLNGFN